jgi:cysteine desulfurase
VSPITSRDFRSEIQQSPRSQEALIGALEISGFDPRKLHHESARLRNALAQARESIAADLGVSPQNLEFVGELGFGFWLGLAGLLNHSTEPFLYSTIDRQIIHAFAREEVGRKVIELPVSAAGKTIYEEGKISRGAIVTWQAANRETGIEQPELDTSEIELFADMTAIFNQSKLPSNWSIALWDPRNFAGPEGIAIVAISKNANWRSPIPNIDNRRTFGSNSSAAVIATAVALRDWQAMLAKTEERLLELNQLTRRLLRERLPGISIAGSEIGDPRRIALVVEGVIAEELLRRLEKVNFLIDAGSACSAAALSPSHVLTALGLGENGQIRLTLHDRQREANITELVDEIERTVRELRA